MDLLLQVSEKELEEFPKPPVDHTDLSSATPRPVLLQQPTLGRIRTQL